MGLDIYAGTLTRYYAHNWKSAVQQWAEENGYTFQKITPDGAAVDDEEEMSPAEVQDIVENWRDQILAAIAAPGHEPYTPWPEDNEKPYYTDKPDWDAFGAMLLVAACRTYEEPVPPTVEKETGTSWRTLLSPVFREMKNGFGHCFAVLPGGSLCRTASCFKGRFLPTIQPQLVQWEGFGKSWKN